MFKLPFWFLTICLLLKSVCSDEQNIYENEKNIRSRFPYQALLRYKGVPFCGGAIIDNKHVLTAANCCKPKSNQIVTASELSIAVGNSDLYDASNVKTVESIFIHEEFDVQMYFNDIAVIRISDSFENSSTVHPINLSKNSSAPGMCNLSGWGTNYYNLRNDFVHELTFMEVPLINIEYCNEAYFSTTAFLDDKKLCAGLKKQDSCLSDTGGPLVCNEELTGIVSISFGCRYANYPTIYTEVVKYADWIEIQKIKVSSVTGRTFFPDNWSLIVTIAIVIENRISFRIV